MTAVCEVYFNVQINKLGSLWVKDFNFSCALHEPLVRMKEKVLFHYFIMFLIVGQNTQHLISLIYKFITTSTTEAR